MYRPWRRNSRLPKPRKKYRSPETCVTKMIKEVGYQHTHLRKINLVGFAGGVPSSGVRKRYLKQSYTNVQVKSANKIILNGL